MRVLLIEDEPKVRALMRHHMSCEWPEAQISAYLPALRGALPAEFLAQGHDAVLLSANVNDGHGLMWLRELTARRGFAPVIYLLERRRARTAARNGCWARLAWCPRAASITTGSFACSRRGAHAPTLAGGLARLARGRGIAPLRGGAHSGLSSSALAGARLGIAAVRGREREGRVRWWY
jgi:hypothetical protein